MKKGMSKNATLILAVVCSFLLGSLFGRLIGQQNTNVHYVELDKTLQEAGYTPVTDDVYEKEHHNLREQVRFDYKNHRIIRNDFMIDMTGAYSCGDTCMIRADKAAEIILKESPTFDTFGKTYAPLIAHAGGGYEDEERRVTYTNSYDAIKQNYDKGHRFFEVDFQFTTDKKFIAAHPVGLTPEIIENADAWVNARRTAAGIEPLTFDKILDLMLVQRDMFLITDTKAFMVDEQGQNEQFDTMYQTVIARDPSLLERIIPQIYSKQMIAQNETLRQFPSVIFTGYAVLTTGDDILETFDMYPNIKMFTTDALGDYIDEVSLLDGLKERGKKVSIHTVNDEAVFHEARYEQVDGYYTDFLQPHDWHTRNQVDRSKPIMDLSTNAIDFRKEQMLFFLFNYGVLVASDCTLCYHV